MRVLTLLLLVVLVAGLVLAGCGDIQTARDRAAASRAQAEAYAAQQRAAEALAAGQADAMRATAGLPQTALLIVGLSFIVLGLLLAWVVMSWTQNMREQQQVLTYAAQAPPVVNVYLPEAGRRYQIEGPTGQWVELEQGPGESRRAYLERVQRYALASGGQAGADDPLLLSGR